MPDVTRAQARVLHKAASGFVVMPGGFGDVLKVHDQDLLLGIGSPTRQVRSVVKDPVYDRKEHIEKLLRGGFLRFGDGSNQYLVTEKGMKALESIPQKWREGYGND